MTSCQGATTAVQLGAVPNHPMVRDLAWLMTAPDLIDTDWPGRPSLTQLGLGEPEHRHAYLAAIDADPSALEAMVGRTATTRLGQYHEFLWQFLLSTAPATELLAHNVPIREEKRTLGELDLLYRNADGRLQHLEVAIKFFLGLPCGPGDSGDTCRWIGPGGLDSLALKVSHLLHHQLPLLQSQRARELLLLGLNDSPANTIKEAPLASLQHGIEAHLAMPGVLFQPWHCPMALPRGVPDSALQGLWCHWRDWSALCRQFENMRFGTCLAKPHWLAPPQPRHWSSRDDLTRALAAHFATYATPVQVMLTEDPLRFEREALDPPLDGSWVLGQDADEPATQDMKNAPPAACGRRIFVVGDDWPRQIPLPPRAVHKRQATTG